MKRHMSKAERKKAATGAIFEVKPPKAKFASKHVNYDMVGKKFDPTTRKYL